MNKPSSNSDSQLLARILQTGNARRGSLELSDRLLQTYGGLRPLLLSSPEELSSIPQLGPRRVDRIAALPLIARRFYEASLPASDPLRSPSDTEAFLIARIGQLAHEMFCCLYLDNRHRVLRFDELFRGTIDGTNVYPREVVKEALSVNAAAIIIAHNHPSGVAEPSQADERITKRLKSALELVDIRLLDHLIVADGTTVSLASRGLL